MRHPQRRVFYVAGLFAEDGAQQLFPLSARSRLRHDLADKDIAGVDLGADGDDAFLVEVAQALLADVRYVTRYLFRAQLGVAGLRLVLLDVDGGELVSSTIRFE